MFQRQLLLAILIASFLSSHARAQGGHEGHGSSHDDHDDHAPLGVMGEHMHDAGEFMLAYRYMRMNMNGNRDDTQRLSVRGARSEFGFPILPFDMDMEMHMLGAMWAPADSITLMAMLPIVRLDMKHRTPMGTEFTTRSNGIGDVRLTGLIRLLEREGHGLHLNAGISFPTGSISEKDDTPMGRVRLPYPMQIGSGTYDLLPGITYNGTQGDWSWGGQLMGTLRTGINHKGYRLGHGWQTTTWLTRRWFEPVSTSLRLDYRQWRNIRGDDDDLMRGLVPTADPDRRAGERLDLLLGVNFLVTGGPLKGNRFAIEVGHPIYQDLDGPQLETDWMLTAGWQLAF